MSESRPSGDAERLIPPSFKSTWLATLRDNLKVYSEHLATAGGAAAVAKTTVAPLERIKVSRQKQEGLQALHAVLLTANSEA